MNNTRSSSFIASIAFAFFVVNLGIGHVVNAQEAVQIKGPKGATEQFSGNVYGPITSEDTLWRVAERYRQNRSLSIYQVMLAIYELNPEAFEQQNLNLMIDGSILRLPSERYIARVDLEDAKARAENDEQAWQRAIRKVDGKVVEVKPISPPVNQDDLSSTKNALEKRLNSLDQTQTRQFDELKDQFALSIKSVESLLEDNKKLYERIDKVNGDLDALREQVDGDVKSTMSAQSQSIEEMLQLLKEEQSLRQEAENSNLLKKLFSPIVLMVISIVITLLVLGGIAYWVFGKKKAPKESSEPLVSDSVAPVDAVSVSETDDLLDEPIDNSEDISDDELFNDDDLLDDVLSSELEESLDDELDSFTDLSDEMLVPDVEGDSDLDDLFEEGDSEIDQSDLDDLFNDSSDSDAFDISGDDESDTSEQSEAVDVDALLDAAIDSDDFDTNDVADKLGIDGDNLDEDALEKLDDQIQKQSQELDKDTENLIGEIDQLEMMGGMLDELDLSDEEDNQDSTEEDTDAAADNESEPNEDALTDDLIDELIDEPATTEDGVSEDASADDIDDIFDSVSQTPPDDVDAILESMSAEPADDLTDDLLEELEAENNPSGEDSEDVDAILESMSPEPSDDLTDDLLEELESEDKDDIDALTDDLIDELLDEPATEAESELSEEASAEDIDDIFDSVSESPSPSDELTDDLLDELEADNAESSDLDENNADDDGAEEHSEAMSHEPSDDLADDVLDALDAKDELNIDSLSDDLIDELVSESEKEEQKYDIAANETAEEAEESAVEQDEDNTVDETVEEAEETAEAPEEDNTVDETAEEAEETAVVPDEDNTLDETADEREESTEFEAAIDDLADESEGQTAAAENTNSIDAIDARTDTLIEELDELGDFDLDSVPSELENAPDFEEVAEQSVPAENDTSSDELADVPSLDELFSEEVDESDSSILDDLENTDFDELLSSIDIDSEDEQDPQDANVEEVESNTNDIQEIEKLEPQPEPETKSEEKEIPQLDNPDLDLNALFSEEETSTASDEELISVDDLLEEADVAESTVTDEEFNLDVSLEEFTGKADDDDIIDVDIDSAQAVNLDLIRAYIDMEDVTAAKALLLEVMQKGSDDQKVEAQSLIDELGDV